MAVRVPTLRVRGIGRRTANLQMPGLPSEGPFSRLRAAGSAADAADPRFPCNLAIVGLRSPTTTCAALDIKKETSGYARRTVFDDQLRAADGVFKKNIGSMITP
jgi:hypothetical protein